MDASPTFLKLDPDKQRRVLDEARREFAGHGFQGASVNRMVARLGIAKGSIFKYFGSKEGLFGAVFAGAVDRLGDTLRVARTDTGAQPLQHRLERLLLAGTDFVRANPDIYRIYLKLLFNESFPLRERFLGRVRQLSAKFLTPIVLQARDSGELPPDLDPALAVFLLDAVLDRFVQAQVTGFMDTGLGLNLNDDRAVAEAARKLAAMLTAALGAGAPGESHAR